MFHYLPPLHLHSCHSRGRHSWRWFLDHSPNRRRSTLNQNSSKGKINLAIVLVFAFRTVRNLVAHFLWDMMSVKKETDQRSTHLHRNGLHVVADEVAQLFVAAIAAILLAVAHLRVVDDCLIVWLFDCLIVYYRYLACCWCTSCRCTSSPVAGGSWSRRPGIEREIFYLLFFFLKSMEI